MRTAPVVDSESMMPWIVIALLPGAGRSSQKARKIGNSSPRVSAGFSVRARATTPKFWPRARARKKVAPCTMANSTGWPLPNVVEEPEAGEADVADIRRDAEPAVVEPRAVVGERGGSTRPRR